MLFAVADVHGAGVSVRVRFRCAGCVRLYTGVFVSRGGSGNLGG